AIAAFQHQRAERERDNRELLAQGHARQLRAHPCGQSGPERRGALSRKHKAWRLEPWIVRPEAHDPPAGPAAFDLDVHLLAEMEVVDRRHAGIEFERRTLIGNNFASAKLTGPATDFPHPLSSPFRAPGRAGPSGWHPSLPFSPRRPSMAAMEVVEEP